jgi:hypothetical protein
MACQTAPSVRLVKTFIDGEMAYTRQLTHKEWTAILAWPGYRVYRHELDEEAKTLKVVGAAQACSQGF